MRFSVFPALARGGLPLALSIPSFGCSQQIDVVEVRCLSFLVVASRGIGRVFLSFFSASLTLPAPSRKLARATTTFLDDDVPPIPPHSCWQKLWRDDLEEGKVGEYRRGRWNAWRDEAAMDGG